MPYMIYQQYTTAIKEAYAGHEDLAQQAATAAQWRRWLASLDIAPRLRDPLVEQAAAIEDAFNDLLRAA
jgi:hypothetical protein